jgi:membrane protease YdiL (CAAX protease family)
MSDLPEQDPNVAEPPAPRREDSLTPEDNLPAERGYLPNSFQEPLNTEAGVTAHQPPLFQSFSQPEPPPLTRIPNFGHLGILSLLVVLGWLGAVALTYSALHFHLFGVRTVDQARTDIYYTLGQMVTLYLCTFGLCLFVFPLVWNEGFFTGLQWHVATAIRLRWRLFSAAVLCFVLAMIDQMVMPGPNNAPIDKLFESRTDAWLLLIFGTTIAPFFEETFFRGFLLPSLCTAWDWAIEKSTGRRPRPLDANGHPEWSIFAMVVGSALTSIPFALMHAEQIAHAVGPLMLLYCVSLILCIVRLSTRSLAASVVVHASYNLLLFSIMLLGTGGFQHMDKM